MPSLLDIQMMQNPVAAGLLQGPQQDAQQATPVPSFQGQQIGQHGQVGGGGPSPLMQGGQAPPGLLAPPGGGGGAPPQPQGPQGAPQAPPGPPPAAQMGVERLSRIFEPSGEPIKRQKIDMRETMLNTGLMLMGGGPGTTMGEALATGVMAGRQAAAMNNQARAMEAQAQERANRYMKVFGDGPMTPERVDKAIQVATISGDTDTLKVLKDIRGQFPEEGSTREFQEIAGKPFFFDSADGNLYRPGDSEPIPLDMLPSGHVKPMEQKEVLDDGTEITRYVDPYTLEEVPDSARRTGLPPKDPRVQPEKMKRTLEDGTIVSELRNPFTNELIPGSTVVVGQEGSGANAQVGEAMGTEIRNIRSLLGVVEEDGEIKDIENAGEFGITGQFGRFAQWRPREMQSTELKNLTAATDNLVSMVILQRSGKQASDAEQERLKNIVAFVPGENEETIRAKLNRLDEMVRIYQQNGADAANVFLAGAAGVPYVTPESAAQSALDRMNQLGGGG